jgi:hypothetical protein
MSVRATHEGGVHHSGQGNVRTKLSAAFKKSLILKSGQSGANSKFTHRHCPVTTPRRSIIWILYPI